MYKSVINIIGGKMLFDSSWTWYFLLRFRGLFTGIVWQILPLLFIDNDFSWLASYTQALSCPACRKRKWTWVWDYQLTQLSSITLRRNQHASQCLCGVDLIIPPPPFLQFSWCQTSAHTHDQAEAMDQDPRAEDKVSAKVSHWWRECCYQSSDHMYMYILLIWEVFV